MIPFLLFYQKCYGKNKVHSTMHSHELVWYLLPHWFFHFAWFSNNYLFSNIFSTYFNILFALGLEAILSPTLPPTKALIQPQIWSKVSSGFNLKLTIFKMVCPAPLWSCESSGNLRPEPTTGPSYSCFISGPLAVL